MIRKIAATLLFSSTLFISSTTSASAPTPIHPVPDSLFHEIYVPDKTIFEPNRNILETRPHIVVPLPKVKVISKIKVVIKPKAVAVKNKSNVLGGNASWYCAAGRSVCVHGYPDTKGFDAYAAAGPKLRVAMGGGVAASAPQPWKNKIILVDGQRVKLIDWCQCLYRTKNEKIIDLYFDVWKVVGGNVTIRW